jgi:hypothetical protein
VFTSTVPAASRNVQLPGSCSRSNHSDTLHGKILPNPLTAGGQPNEKISILVRMRQQRPLAAFPVEKVLGGGEGVQAGLHTGLFHCLLLHPICQRAGIDTYVYSSTHCLKRWRWSHTVHTVLIIINQYKLNGYSWHTVS